MVVPLAFLFLLKFKKYLFTKFVSLASQCSTLVRNTVVRATHAVNGRLGNSTPRGSKTPEPIEMKLYMVDYVTHPTPHAQFG